MSEETKSRTTNPFQTALIVILAGIIGFFGGVFAMGINDEEKTSDSCWQVAAAGGEYDSFVKFNVCTGESYLLSLSGRTWHKLQEKEE